jgi:hypothetical protein
MTLATAHCIAHGRLKRLYVLAKLQCSDVDELASRIQIRDGLTRGRLAA